jgi:thioredoxin-like negative regulator of GroEL
MARLSGEADFNTIPDTIRMPVGRLDSYPVPVSAIHANYANRRFLINLIVLGKPRSDETRKGNSSKGIMDKAAALPMELAGRGETEAALSEFTSLLENDGNYTAGYFMAAQTLANAGRTPEAIERLKAGIASARRAGNTHAASEMQAMLDELDR